MITLETLAKNIQTKLQAQSSSFDFNIVADTGAYKPPKRQGNTVTEYINGVLTSNSSEITNLIAGAEKPLIYATQNCTLRVIMSLQKPENDEYIIEDGTVYKGALTDLPENTVIVDTIVGWQTKLQTLRATLNAVFQGVTVENLTDKDGKSYSVSTVYSFANSGIREQNQAVGDSYTFYINVYYSFIQNGVNTRDMTFMLDGAIIPFQSVTIYRTPIMDGNVYANTKNGTAKNMTTQSTFSISFELPAFENDTTTESIVSFLLDGEINVAHLLRFEYLGKTREYMVTMGEVKNIGETIKNVGQTLTLVEIPADYDLISFPPSYFIYQSTSASYTIFPQKDAQTYVFGKDIGFRTEPITVNSEAGEMIVSTAEITNEQNFERVQ